MGLERAARSAVVDAGGEQRGGDCDDVRRGGHVHRTDRGWTICANVESFCAKPRNDCGWNCRRIARRRPGSARRYHPALPIGIRMNTNRSCTRILTIPTPIMNTITRSDDAQYRRTRKDAGFEGRRERRCVPIQCAARRGDLRRRHGGATVDGRRSRSTFSRPAAARPRLLEASYCWEARSPHPQDAAPARQRSDGAPQPPDRRFAASRETRFLKPQNW